MKNPKTPKKKILKEEVSFESDFQNIEVHVTEVMDDILKTEDYEVAISMDGKIIEIGTMGREGMSDLGNALLDAVDYFNKKKFKYTPDTSDLKIL